MNLFILGILVSVEEPGVSRCCSCTVSWSQWSPALAASWDLLSLSVSTGTQMLSTQTHFPYQSQIQESSILENLLPPMSTSSVFWFSCQGVAGGLELGQEVDGTLLFLLSCTVQLLEKNSFICGTWQLKGVPYQVNMIRGRTIQCKSTGIISYERFGRFYLKMR